MRRSLLRGPQDTVAALSATTTQASLDGGVPDEWEEDEINFMAAVGILLLRATMPQLQALTTLPDVLDGLRLHLAAVALRYARTEPSTRRVIVPCNVTTLPLPEIAKLFGEGSCE